MFISFEGIDGSGKSTQIKLLKNKFSKAGQNVHVFREPGGTDLSEKVRTLLLNSDYEIHPVTELLLFSAARAQLISEKVKPLLDQQAVVILDRYYDSTVAYQGYGRESLPLQDIDELNTIASHNLEPEITFYLDIPLEEAQKRTHRQAKDRMELAGPKFYEKVIEGFEDLEKRLDRFKAIDATGSPEETHQRILNKLSEFLGVDFKD